MGSFLNFLVQGPRLALPDLGLLGPALCVAGPDHRWKQRDSENYSFQSSSSDPVRPFWQARVLASESAVWLPSSP